MSLSNISSKIRSDAADRGLVIGQQRVTVEPTRYELEDATRFAPSCQAGSSPADAIRVTLGGLTEALALLRKNADTVAAGQLASVSMGGMSIITTPAIVGEDEDDMEARSMAIFPLLTDDESAMVFACVYHLLLADLAGMEAGRLEFVAAGSAVFDVGFAPTKLHYGGEVIGLGDANQFLDQMAVFLDDGFCAGMGRWYRRVGSPVMISCQRIEADPGDLDGALEMAQNIQDSHWRGTTEDWIRRTNKARA